MRNKEENMEKEKDPIDIYRNRIRDTDYKVEEALRELSEDIIPDATHFRMKVEEFLRRVASKNYAVTVDYICNYYQKTIELTKKIKEAQTEMPFRNVDIRKWHQKLFDNIDKLNKEEWEKDKLKNEVSRIIIALYELSVYLNRKVEEPW